MGVLLKTLGLDRLSAEERLALAEELWDSIGEADAVPLTAAQRSELDHRLRDLDDDPDRGTPWAEVRKALDARFRR